MSEYLLNNYRVFDTGDYPDRTIAFAVNLGELQGQLMAVSCHWLSILVRVRYPLESSRSLDVIFNNLRDRFRPIAALCKICIIKGSGL